MKFQIWYQLSNNYTALHNAALCHRGVISLTRARAHIVMFAANQMCLHVYGALKAIFVKLKMQLYGDSRGLSFWWAISPRGDHKCATRSGRFITYICRCRYNCKSKLGDAHISYIIYACVYIYNIYSIRDMQVRAYTHICALEMRIKNAAGAQYNNKYNSTLMHTSRCKYRARSTWLRATTRAIVYYIHSPNI